MMMDLITKQKNNAPARLKTSAAIGTVLLTGLLMIATHASGHAWAMPSHRPATMPALMLKRSSRVMPGLRGTPFVLFCFVFGGEG